jgi:ubiquinone/menaquinone biosynthesis C-methylase UbiE
MSGPELTEHALKNREFWDNQSAEYDERNAKFIERGMAWGLWQISEAELQVLGDVEGKDVLELGCGSGDWCRSLLRAGARPVGLDNSEARLERARAGNEAAGVEFPLLHASAEAIPLEDASFDVATADWGAPTFSDPYLFVPETARVLRRGGLFVFSGATPLAPLGDARGVGRVHAPDRRVDPALPALGLRDRGPDRGAAVRGR